VGALDMIGNIWEWCLNQYEPPQNIGMANNANRVIRGGSFAEKLSPLTFRVSHDPNFKHANPIGFRVVYATSFF
jgi:formylglycine-generating enzyme required for sulfatase activity